MSTSTSFNNGHTIDLLSISIVDLLMEWVRFPSVSLQEKELVDWLEDAVRRTGLLKIDRYEDNLIFSLGDGPDWLFLNSHSDVVPVSLADDAVGFDPYIKDHAIWGRGTTDAKGCGTTMIKAILELAQTGWRPTQGKVSFALTVCEETSGENNGMAYLRSLMDNGVLPLPNAAIIGEPTLLAPCIAQKGLLVLKLYTKGDSGHAARVYGSNAITEMGHVLTRLASIHFEDENPFIGKVKITPTRITGGVANNVMPEVAEVVVDIRTIPEYPNAMILERLKSELKCEILVHSDRFISTATDRNERIVKVAEQVTGAAPFGSPTASDWVFLHDIPTIKLGPGNSELSHRHNEHIVIEQLEAGVEVYKKIITGYFERQ